MKKFICERCKEVISISKYCKNTIITCSKCKVILKPWYKPNKAILNLESKLSKAITIKLKEYPDFVVTNKFIAKFK